MIFPLLLLFYSFPFSPRAQNKSISTFLFFFCLHSLGFTVCVSFPLCALDSHLNSIEFLSPSLSLLLSYNQQGLPPTSSITSTPPLSKSPFWSPQRAGEGRSSGRNVNCALNRKTSTIKCLSVFCSL